MVHEPDLKPKVQPVSFHTQYLDDCTPTQSRFLEIEDVSAKSPWSKEELECEAHFLKITIRLNNGQFEVTIPLYESIDKLGDLLEQAKNRFLH